MLNSFALTCSLEEKRVTIRYTCASCRSLRVHAKRFATDYAIQNLWGPVDSDVNRDSQCLGMSYFSSHTDVPKTCRAFIPERACSDALIQRLLMNDDDHV